MSYLTYLYQALANARQAVTDIERAIESAKNRPTGYTGQKGFNNVDTNGNYRREDFYDWIEQEENQKYDR